MSRKIAQQLILTATGVQFRSQSSTKTDTFQLDPGATVDFYTLTTSGAVTLTNNVSITNDNSVRTLPGDFFEIKYSGNVNLGGYTLSFFGQDLPSHLTRIDIIIQAYYDGTDWNVVFLPSVVAGIETINNDNIVADSITTGELAASAVGSSELASNAVTTAKITDANVTVEKLENEAKETSITIPVHFDWSAKDDYYVIIPIKCTLIRVSAVVSGTAVSGGAATLTLTNGGASVYSGQTLFASGAGENTSFSNVPSSNTAISKDGILKFTVDGAATAGKAFISIAVRKEAE